MKTIEQLNEWHATAITMDDEHLTFAELIPVGYARSQFEKHMLLQWPTINAELDGLKAEVEELQAELEKYKSTWPDAGECDGCERIIGEFDFVYWDHTEGDNGLQFHSEMCAIDYTVSQAELWADRN